MKKLNHILFILLCIAAQTGCSADTIAQKKIINLPELIPYRNGNLWGYSDHTGKIIIKCQYAYAELFDSFGFAKVYNKIPQINSEIEVGLIDRKGQVVIPITAREQLFYCVINDDGVVGNRYGIYNCVKYDGKIIVIGEEKPLCLKRNIFISLSQEEGSGFYECFNRFGKNILSDSYSYITHCENNKYEVKYIVGMNKNTKKSALFTLNGTRINNLTFDRIYPFDTASFITTQIDINNKPLNSAIYKINGEKVIDGLTSFNIIPDGVYLSGRNFFKVNGVKYEVKQQIDPTYYFYDQCTSLSKSLNGKTFFGVIDRNLSLITNISYDKIKVDTIFKNLFLFEKGNMTCTDLNGNIKFSIPGIEEIDPITASKFITKTKLGYGLWSSQENKYIINSTYKKIRASDNNKLVLEGEKFAIVANSSGIYRKQDSFERVSLDGNFGFNNDILYHLDSFGNWERIASDVWGATKINDIILYYQYRNKYSKQYELSLISIFKISEKKVVLDSLKYEKYESSFSKINDLLIVSKLQKIEPKTALNIYSLGVIDINGNVVLPIEYDHLEILSSYMVAIKKNTYDFFDLKGNYINSLQLPLSYHYYHFYVNGLFESYNEFEDLVGYSDIFNNKFYK